MRHWILPVVLYVALTVALTLPILLHFTSAIPHDAGDPVLNSWILWWSTERVPLTASWWNAPMFHPAMGMMALSEVLIGLLPITAIVQYLTASPLAAYNTAFVLSFPLCALAAYALAFELTKRQDAAIVTGLAFAFAPYRVGHLSHVQMLSYYWAPVALLGLHVYLRTRQRRWLGVFALAWLAQALSNGYALFHLSVLIALWVIWFARPIRTAVSIVAVWFVAALPMIPLLLKYREVHSYLHLARDINEIKGFGVDVADFLRASPELSVWGAYLGVDRPETPVFPGATVLVVGAVWLAVRWWNNRNRRAARTLDQNILIAISAGAALVALSRFAFGPWAIGPLTVTDFYKPFSIAVAARLLAFARSEGIRRGWREHSVVVFYGIAAFTLYLLALGPEPRLLGRTILYEPPYAWLMHLPGFGVLRVPARFAMLGILCQSVLLGYAVARWSLSRLQRRVVVTAICVGLLADGWFRLRIENAPATFTTNWSGVAAIVELPPGSTAADFGAIYRSMFHRLPIVNGYSGYYPPQYQPFLYAMRYGQYSALEELAAHGTLGIAVDRRQPDAERIQKALAFLGGIQPGPAEDGWATFVLPSRPQPDVRLGAAIPIASVRAAPHPEDVARMMDGNIETAWGSGGTQIGEEDVLVDLGSVRAVGAIVFEMGAYSFGFPRSLEIDVSSDGAQWDPIWGGRPAPLTIRAAIKDPSVVPLTIDVGRATGRFVRLRQTGSEPGIPWWIPELKIYGPADGQ